MAEGNEPRPMQIFFKSGYGRDDILEHAKNMPNDCFEFWVNSNNPVNQPPGCSWGAYLFMAGVYSGVKRITILYFDGTHIANAGVNANSETIEWHVA